MQTKMIMQRGLAIATSAIALAILAACGGGGGGGVSNALTGVFVDSPVAGIGYRTATQSGTTNSKGEFSYLAGESVTFSVGSVALPTVVANATITPLDIASSKDINNQVVSNILVLLQSLDQDGNPANGISIPPTAAAAATANINFDVAPNTFAANAALTALIASSGSTTTAPVSAATAKAHFQDTLTGSNGATKINVAPQANAGSAQSVLAGAVVVLDASASSDANNDVLTYAWTITSKPLGSATVLSSATAAAPTLMPDVVGTYTASLVVSDGLLNSAPVSVIVTATVAPTIVTSVPTPTYGVGSEELAAFNLLNNERLGCGFGLLKQAVSLDESARGHSDWLLTNNYTGHYQVTGTPGFTGVSPVDRLVASSYGLGGLFDSTEVETDSGGSKTGQGVIGVRGLLNAPYHLLGMLRGYRDVGIGSRDKSDISLSPNNRNALNIDMGALSVIGRQAPLTGSVRTYPCDGTTGVGRSLTSESPSPVAAGRNLLTNPIGTSIGVVVDVGNTLVITSASLVNVNTSEPVTLLTPITGSTDPNATGGSTYIGLNEGFVSADAPLLANTQYRAIINGTSNGVEFTRTILFTTGG